MAVHTTKSLLDAIDPNASSDDEGDEDFSLPEIRSSKRRKGTTRDCTAPTPKDLERTALDAEQEKADRLRKAEAEWQALLKVEEDAKKERMASSSSILGQSETAEEEMIEIRRPRNFAGEIIYEIVALPGSHPDVKRYKSMSNVNQGPEIAQGDATASNTVAGPARDTALLPHQADLYTASTTCTPEAALASTVSTSTMIDSPILSTAKDKFKPGPVKRKRPRQSLEAMNAELKRQAAAAKKMSTFEKSQMDWKQLTSTSDALSTDLEANRRAGGFLEKQDFLGRVAGRREDDARGLGEGRCRN